MGPPIRGVKLMPGMNPVELTLVRKLDGSNVNGTLLKVRC